MLLKMDPRKRYWGKDLDQTEGVVERDMLMLFEIYGGPVLYALYRVEVPYLSPPSEIQQSIEFRPILELPCSEFPNAMSCVQIDTTKFYFVAGEFEPSSRPNPNNCDRNIYLLDTAHIDKNNSNHHDLVKKNVVGSLISGKSNPYCFEALGKIYVMDTTGLSFMRSSSGSYFEVFDPSTSTSTGGQCVKLPNPPVILLTRGHALVDKKLFLSGLAGGSSRHVICFDLQTNQWVQDFFQDFPYGHFLWGEGKLIGSDNLFAISGTAPTLFKFSPERVQQHLAATNSKDDENLTGLDDTDLSDDDTDEFEFDPPPALLFDDFALPSHNLRVIHKLANYHDHMPARLVDLGEGVFGYILCGKLPSYEKPEYIGMILVVFKPDLKLVTEEVDGETRKGFTGTLLHSAQFKFNSTDPVCNMLSCFSVPRESENADAARAKLQVHSKAVIRGKEVVDVEAKVAESKSEGELPEEATCLKKLVASLRNLEAEVDAMVAESKSKGVLPEETKCLQKLKTNLDKAYKKFYYGDSSSLKEDLGLAIELKELLKLSLNMEDSRRQYLNSSVESMLLLGMSGAAEVQADWGSVVVRVVGKDTTVLIIDSAEARGRGITEHTTLWSGDERKKMAEEVRGRDGITNDATE